MTAPRTALVLIDLQLDFLGPDGRLPVAKDQVAPLLARVTTLTAAARTAGLPVAHVVNAFPQKSWLNVFRRFAAVAGSPGAALDPRGPTPTPDEPVFTKARSDAFSHPELAAWLRARCVTRVVLCGVFANACVRATARGALAAGFEALVVRDGVAAASARSRDRGLAAIHRAGAQVVGAADLDLTALAQENAA